MSRIEKLLTNLGSPYEVRIIDGEPCIYRILGNYEFEVSGTHHAYCTLYVWTVSPRKISAIYTDIPTKSLKDILGYYASLYQNLPAQIRVERQDTKV